MLAPFVLIDQILVFQSSIFNAQFDRFNISDWRLCVCSFFCFLTNQKGFAGQQLFFLLIKKPNANVDVIFSTGITTYDRQSILLINLSVTLYLLSLRRKAPLGVIIAALQYWEQLLETNDDVTRHESSRDTVSFENNNVAIKSSLYIL